MTVLLGQIWPLPRGSQNLALSPPRNLLLMWPGCESALILKSLKLPTVAASYEEVAAQAVVDGWTHENYLGHLLELEAEDRRRRRIARYLKNSKLPSNKTLATLDQKCLPTKVARMLPSLCDGGFAERAENIIAIGNPGTGKSHIVSAIGHELVSKGIEVLFAPTFRLVQRLLKAKRDLCLESLLRRLDRFAVVILDDIGYVQQERGTCRRRLTLFMSGDLGDSD